MDEANDIKIYHLAPAQGRVLFARSLALQLSLTAGAGAVMAWYDASRGWLGRPSAWVTLVMILVTLVLLQLRLVRRMVRQAMTYQLTVGPNVLRMAGQGLVTTEALRPNVTRIVETSRGLRLYTGSSFVAVPSRLTGYAEVRARVGEWGPIVRSRLGHLWTAIVLGQLALWTAPMVLQLQAATAVAMLSGVIVAAGVLVILVTRAPLAKSGKARLYALELLLAAWAALRIYSVWSGR
jgi:hypothetical protein